MKFTFTNEAINYVLNKLNGINQESYNIIIDYVDGNSPYSDGSSACHCEVYNKYRILIVRKNDTNIKYEKYNKSLDTNLGKAFYPEFYEMMFNENNVFDFNNFNLFLKSEAGIISEQVKLIIKL